jgi:coatomer subunit beta
MAANLYARSIFGEDALANVSIEKPIHQGPDAAVTGHIRIRAKSQVTITSFESICELNKGRKNLGLCYFYSIISYIDIDEWHFLTEV